MSSDGEPPPRHLLGDDAHKAALAHAGAALDDQDPGRVGGDDLVVEGVEAIGRVAAGEEPAHPGAVRHGQENPSFSDRAKSPILAYGREGGGVTGDRGYSNPSAANPGLSARGRRDYRADDRWFFYALRPRLSRPGLEAITSVGVKSFVRHGGPFLRT